MGRPAPEPDSEPARLTPASGLQPQAPDAGVYIHIPFCSSICNYCNFNRRLLDDALKTRYVAALMQEIDTAEVPAPRAAAEKPPHPSTNRLGIDTVYFGGGTPSLLDPADIASIVGRIRKRFDVARDAEITLETNPETVDRVTLERFRAAGANRLSFGVQSFDDGELRRLGRVHSADRARRAVDDARAAGFDNVSLDLMMWLPGQTVARWLENVDALIAAAPDHASLYLLELYPNAPLKEEMARAGWSLAPDDDAADMYLAAMDRLEGAGLAQYEISNVARAGRQSRHNLKYWTGGEWLAFGCGAHGTFGGMRWKNVADTIEYVDRVTARESVIAERRALIPRERLEEELFMGLRLNAGIDLDGMKARHGVDVVAEYGAALRAFFEAGWLVQEERRLRLTRDGMLMANEVMAVFV